MYKVHVTTSINLSDNLLQMESNVNGSVSLLETEMPWFNEVMQYILYPNLQKFFECFGTTTLSIWVW